VMQHVAHYHVVVLMSVVDGVNVIIMLSSPVENRNYNRLSNYF
jgi:hypothetical protein